VLNIKWGGDEESSYHSSQRTNIETEESKQSISNKIDEEMEVQAVIYD